MARLPKKKKKKKELLKVANANKIVPIKTEESINFVIGDKNTEVFDFR